MDALLSMLIVFTSIHYYTTRNNEVMPKTKGNIILVKDEKKFLLYTVIADIKESELTGYNYTSFTPATDELSKNLIDMTSNIVQTREEKTNDLYYFKIILTKEELGFFKSNEKVYSIIPPFLAGYKIEVKE